MPTWIHAIYWIMLTVEVRFLVEVSISGDEPSHLRVVVPRSDLAQPRIAFGSVAALCAIHVGTRAAAKSSNCIAEAVKVDPVDLRLAGVGDDTLVALAIEKRDFAVLADEGVTVSIDGSRGASLLLDQDLPVSIVELVVLI